jgi:hypothetical protein
MPPFLAAPKHPEKVYNEKRMHSALATASRPNLRARFPCRSASIFKNNLLAIQYLLWWPGAPSAYNRPIAPSQKGPHFANWTKTPETYSLYDRLLKSHDTDG